MQEVAVSQDSKCSGTLRNALSRAAAKDATSNVARLRLCLTVEAVSEATFGCVQVAVLREASYEIHILRP